MTAETAPNQQPSIAQMIHVDTQAMRHDLATILKLTKETALPLEGEEVSVLTAMVTLLQMIVTKVEQNGQSIEALHQSLTQPGIAHVLRRMLDAD